MESSSGSQRTCKWCSAPLSSGRRSKAYCDDTCKQAAYYHRRKSAGNTHNDGVTAGKIDTVANHTPDSVTDHTDTNVTNHNNLIADAPQARPDASFSELSHNQTNNHFKMEYNQTTDDDYSAEGQSTKASPSDEGAINVMGMGIDREFITGLLETMPEAQQRELSLMMMETVLERYPDLLGRLGGAPHRSNYRRSVTDETVSDEDEQSGTGEDEDINEQGHEGYEKVGADREDEAYESGNEGSDEDKGEGNDDASGNDYGEYGYGNNDDAREAPENDEGEGEPGSVEPNDRDDSGMGQSSQPDFVTEREKVVPVFRLGGGMNKANADTANNSLRHDTRNTANEQPTFKASCSRKATVTERPERGTVVRQQQDKSHESSASYLNRFFDSSRIKTGMKVWEELTVTVPVFMQDYLMRYATDHLIGAQSAGEATGRLVTLHILFHRSQHRRAVCRLLDLVVEAEEGVLSQTNFMQDGTLSPHQSAGTPKGKAPEEDDSHEDDNDDNAGPIDYDCYGSPNINSYPARGMNPYMATQGMAMQQSMNPVLQMLGIGVPRRA